MDSYASPPRRGAPRLLIGFLAALWLAVPLPAGSAERVEEKDQAAKVAKKVEKARGAAHQAEEEREALRDFQKEVVDYAELHDKELAKLGLPVATNASEAVAAQKAFAHAIAERRAKARRGDIFGPDVEPLFRRLVAEQLRGPDALDARHAVLEGNPGQADEEASVPVVLRVNAEYPSGAPRSTVPPSVLMTLPPLPESLHYRFVGRDLVLVDSVAQLIVDFLPNAAPDLSSQ